MTKTNRLVACTLGRDDLAEQAARWSALRAAAGLGCEETRVGLRLRFRSHSDVERELRSLVAVENECCSWAAWEVVRENGELVMIVRSSGDGVAALHEMFV